MGVFTHGCGRLEITLRGTRNVRYRRARTRWFAAVRVRPFGPRSALRAARWRDVRVAATAVVVVSWALAQGSTRVWCGRGCDRRDVVSSWALAQGSTRCRGPVRVARMGGRQPTNWPRRDRCCAPFANRAATAAISSSGWRSSAAKDRTVPARSPSRNTRLAGPSPGRRQHSSIHLREQRPGSGRQQQRVRTGFLCRPRLATSPAPSRPRET